MLQRTLFALMFVICGGSIAVAGQAPIVIAGRVTDTTAAAVSGAVVILADQTAPTQSRAVTDDDGVYRVTAPSPGRYRLIVSATNFATIVRDVVVADTALSVDVTLPLALSAQVVVTGARTFRNPADLTTAELGLVGVARAASEGAATAADLARRPLLRPGELLEAVPGLVISQHSGDGKANQYYLRGFNLDHGTDFATTIAGVPVNLPTHAHGHGYSDVSFLVPELVTGVQYRKGPYFAESGDFSAAGGATVSYANRLDRPFATISTGEDGWRRVLAAASPRVGGGHLLAGVELARHDGPWTRPDEFQRLNAVGRYTRGTAQNAVSLTAQSYTGKWFGTDQVPRRAIESGRIGRFDTLDDTGGGTTARHSVALELQRTTAASLTRATAFALRYRLNLFSNFTYTLDDADAGDQFEQADRRWVGGARVSHRRLLQWGGRDVEALAGAELRHDAIGLVGLYRTAARQRLSTVREDAVRQTSAGGFGQIDVEWQPWLRSTAGLRVDAYRFDVTASDAVNSGHESAALVSPKGGVALGPWKRTELYVNAGAGFHSNDARGTTITRDPITGGDASRVTPLVRATGAEVGVRTTALPGAHMTLAVWRLDLASELIFVGDAGTTEPGRSSTRTGLEWSAYVRLTPWLTADADVAWSHARFDGDDPAGSHIPGSLQTVVSGGVALDSWRRFSASARLRYFGPRPLIEDGGVRSAATALVNIDAGYALSSRTRLFVDVFNVFDRAASDIDYFYTSRLPGEAPEGVDDIHTHPAAPRTFRVGLTFAF